MLSSECYCCNNAGVEIVVVLYNEIQQVYDIMWKMVDVISYDVRLGGKEVAERKEIDIGWKCPPCSWPFPRGSVPPRRLAAHSKLIPFSPVQPGPVYNIADIG